MRTLPLGQNSKVYRVFHDALGLPYYKFAQFMAALFLVCWMHQKWNELWTDEVIKTERFIPPKIFYKVIKD